MPVRRRCGRDERSPARGPAPQEGLLDASRPRSGQGAGRRRLRERRQHRRSDGDRAFRSEDAARGRAAGDRVAHSRRAAAIPTCWIWAPTRSCTPAQLCQFAVMGSMLGGGSRGRSRAAAGSACSTSAKRKSRATKSCRPHTMLMSAADINYVGFVEGHDIFSDKVDVVVTDGFTGNVALKTMEGAARLIADALREEFTRNRGRKLGASRPRGRRLRRAAHAPRSQALQWRDHGRVERHRDQESRRRRRVRLSARHRSGGTRSAQRRAGAESRNGWALQAAFEG